VEIGNENCYTFWDSRVQHFRNTNEHEGDLG